MKTAHNTFIGAFTSFAEFDMEGQAPSVGRLLVERIRKIEALHRFKDPKDLMDRVEAQFQRYASRGDVLSEGGPWAFWLVASAIDPAGAMVLIRNVVRAEIEGIMPKKWTE